MTFTQFRSRYLLKLKEAGLTASEEEIKKAYLAAVLVRENDVKQARNTRMR